MVKKKKIFLASSNELKEDRKKFAAFITRLNEHYESKGYYFIYKVWEFLDPAYNGRPKQEEYNDEIKKCDFFVALFHTKAGKYTIQELQVAREECQIRHLPLFIYFKDLDYWQALQKKDDNLEAVKKLIGDDMQHFWGGYGNNDKLHLDFVLWLDGKLEQNSPIKVENKEVKIGELSVASFLQLPFVANNTEYQRIEGQLDELEQDIEQLRQYVKDYPEDKSFSEKLLKKMIARDKLQQEVLRQQDALLGAARSIAEMRKHKTSVKLTQASDEFYNGHLDVANKILDEIKQDGERLVEETIIIHEQLHAHIEGLCLQAKTIMANGSINIEERIDSVLNVYAKADEWSNLSAYDKKKYVLLLREYAQFLYQNAKYDLAEEIYLREIKMTEDLYGTNSDQIAISFNNLGMIYFYNGEYVKAMEYYNKAGLMLRSLYGDDNLISAAVITNIGMLYLSRGDYSKNVADFKSAQKDYQHALKYYFKSLEIREHHIDSNHPDIANSYHNIGGAYCGLNKFDLALDYYFRALAIDEKNDDDQINIAATFCNIGVAYYYKRDFNKALAFYFKSLKIREIAFGQNHPETAATYINIGMVYLSQNKIDKSLELLKKAHNILMNVLGPEHLSTIQAQSAIEIADALKNNKHNKNIVEIPINEFLNSFNYRQ